MNPIKRMRYYRSLIHRLLPLGVRPLVVTPCLLLGCMFLMFLLEISQGKVVLGEETAEGLQIVWKDNFLTIHGPGLPEGGVRTNYLEAYCRPGSTDRDWHETVIPHKARLVSASNDGKHITLEDRLADGVVVRHQITADTDSVSFLLQAHNPTRTTSQAHWAQPCVRVDTFTGRDQQSYVPKCFLFLDGKATRLPVRPWATVARYTPGQVWCPKDVDRNDVNPRPLSKLVPSNGLVGCYSADERTILAMAWQPYQELFQGVITCIHSDFRIGGLEPGETKLIRGKYYVVPADIDLLLARYRRDFPEQVEKEE